MVSWVEIRPLMGQNLTPFAMKSMHEISQFLANCFQPDDIIFFPKILEKIPDLYMD